MNDGEGGVVTAARGRRKTAVHHKDTKRLRRFVEGWEAVGDIASCLARNMSLSTILNESVRISARTLDADVVAVLLLGPDGRHLEVRASVGLEIGDLEPFEIPSGVPLMEAAHRNLTEWAKPDRLHGGDAFRPERAFYYPLTFRDVPLGVFVLMRNQEPYSFDSAEIKVIVTISQLLATAAFTGDALQAVMGQERAEREIQFAQTVKGEALQIALPEVPGYRLDARTLQGIETGGDFYDALHLPDGRLVCVAGESSGRGVRAALSVVSVISILRKAIAEGESIVDAVARLNRVVLERRGRSTMISLCVAEIEPEKARARLLRVGSTAAFHLVDERMTELQPEGGIPLGVLSKHDVEPVEVELPPGTALLLATQGLRQLGLEPEGEEASATPACARELIESSWAETQEGGDVSLAVRIARQVLQGCCGNLLEDELLFFSIEAVT